MAAELDMSQVERLHALYERILSCQACDLHASITRKVFDRNLITYPLDHVKVVIVGMAPAYCEDRTGLPLVGDTELLEARCGWCVKFVDCFKYFLHMQNAYKHHEYPCPYPPQDPVAYVDYEKFKNRLCGVPEAMRVDEHGGTDIRTAGMLLNLMLNEAGLLRSTMADFTRDTAEFVNGQQHDPFETVALPHCAMINTVQCRACVRGDDGKLQNVDPTASQRAACLPLVEEFITTISPSVIVALGSHAVLSTTNLTNPTMGEIVRGQYPSRFNADLPVVPLYHPSSYLHRISQAHGKADEAAKRDAVNADIAADIEVFTHIREAFYGAE